MEGGDGGKAYLVYSGSCSAIGGQQAHGLRPGELQRLPGFTHRQTEGSPRTGAAGMDKKEQQYFHLNYGGDSMRTMMKLKDAAKAKLFLTSAFSTSALAS